ncbi:MAG: fibronectin type III domain-containing protein [Verrucomicrobia bacterium]|nr:fibronectin type III domain-containing protein [Verrucomicrobiota bacterium]
MSRYLTLFLLALSGIAASAVELLAPPVVVVTETSATLTWRTDVACGTRVNFGLNAAQLTQKAEGPVTANHSVVLPDLTKGTTYHYTVGSARQKLAEGTFTVGAAQTAPVASAAVAEKSILERMKDALVPAPAVKKPAAPAPARTPPTRATWGSISSLQDHYDRHGPDFQSTSPDDYAAQAWQFLQRAKAGALSMKWDDADRTLRVFDPKTRAFAAYNRDGTTKTYFRPNSASYWDRQPGRPISPAQLPFK